MLTKEMASESIMGLADTMAESLTKRKKWCDKCIKLESLVGKSLVNSRWAIGSSIDIEKKDLPVIRKVVGRFNMVYKTHVERQGKDMVRVVIKPQSKDWKPLQFAYEVQYRPGKCKVVEQTHSYKTLVCSK